MDGATIASIVTLGVIAVGAIAGGIKGFARQVIELVGLLVSFFVAAVIASWLAAFLAANTSIPHVPALVIAFLAVFVGGLVAFHFVAISAQRLIRTTLFGWVDRACGAMLGVIAATLLASVLATIALDLPLGEEWRSGLERSSVVAFVQPVAGWLFDLALPHDRGPIATAAATIRG
jgi:uncharacterized membrane protein required for colicin V production